MRVFLVVFCLLGLATALPAQALTLEEMLQEKHRVPLEQVTLSSQASIHRPVLEPLGYAERAEEAERAANLLSELPKRSEAQEAQRQKYLETARRYRLKAAEKGTSKKED